MLEEEYVDNMDEEEMYSLRMPRLVGDGRGAKGIIITVLRHGQKDMEQLNTDVVLKLCEDIQKEDEEDKDE